jgi:hypothetical protein
MITVHDNRIYGCSSEFETQLLTLHTVDENSPPAFTDVIFRGVVANRFEYTLPSNILFDIVEVNVEKVVDDFAILFQASWRFGWPPIEYDGDLELLKQILNDDAVRGFEVDSSYGLSGWVLSSSCERVRREKRVVFVQA